MMMNQFAQAIILEARFQLMFRLADRFGDKIPSRQEWLCFYYSLTA